MPTPVAPIAGLFRRAALAVASMVFAPIAFAQQIPPLETGPAVTTASFSLEPKPAFSLRDAQTNESLIDPRTWPVFANLDPAVNATVDFQAQPSGGDLIYTFTNPTATPRPLPVLQVGIITLGQQISYLDVRESIDPVAIDANNYTGWGYEYPSYLYSPLFVLQSAQYAMGISIHYPILEYEHHVKLNLTNPAGIYLNGDGGRGFAARFSLSTTGPENWQTVQYPAAIKPGETRVYVVSIRVTKNTSEWVRTLVPYRNYFRSMYGGATYTRENSPVWAVFASDPSRCAADNPLGWLPEWRPDLNGWSGMASVLKNQTQGWDSVMVWLPSGSYWKNPQNNFPCQPATPWLSSPNLSTIFDPATGMPSVSSSGKELGFWWGRSCQTAATWDPVTLEDFDPDNPVHFGRKLQELDLMARAGAITVGLDTFDPVNTPFFKQYRWMLTMRLRYPHLKFVTEPTNCDIMHTLAGNFITGWEFNKIPATPEDCYTVKHANYLADFLVPGHEFWAGFRYNEMKQYFGITPDQNKVIADMERYASYGYRPVFAVLRTWWGLTIPQGVAHAAKSWETTVPADLQISDAPVPFGPVASGSSRVGISTGSRPIKNGSNVVAGSRPNRSPEPPPPSYRPLGVRPSSKITPPELIGHVATSRPDGVRRPNTADALRALNAIRKANGLAPVHEEADVEELQDGVQTFTNPKPAPPGKPPVVIPKAPKKDG